jgi:large subunit ribosomal protein L28
VVSSATSHRLIPEATGRRRRGCGRILVRQSGRVSDARPTQSRDIMSQRCDICGKGPMTGNNVSHSKVHTKRRFLPNLHATHLVLKGREVKARVCTRCLRTQAKAARS